MPLNHAAQLSKHLSDGPLVCRFATIPHSHLRELPDPLPLGLWGLNGSSPGLHAKASGLLLIDSLARPGGLHPPHGVIHEFGEVDA
jgi:hypothetical protein